MVALRSPRRPAEPAATPAVESVAAPVEPVVVPSDAAPMLETLQVARDSIPDPGPDVSALSQQMTALQQAEETQRQALAQMQIQRQQQPQEPPQLSERDLQFLGSRPGVEKDPAFVQTVGALAHVFTYGTPAFYDALEMKFPRSHYRREEPRHEPESPAIVESKMEEKPTRRVVTSAPVSRNDSGMPSNYAPGPSSVKLSPAEREIAAGAGMTDQEYALQKIRLAKAKRDGMYNESN